MILFQQVQTNSRSEDAAIGNLLDAIHKQRFQARTNFNIDYKKKGETKWNIVLKQWERQRYHSLLSH